jgi:hypothetical protein
MSVSVHMSVSAYKSVSIQLIVHEKCGGDVGGLGGMGSRVQQYIQKFKKNFYRTF